MKALKFMTVAEAMMNMSKDPSTQVGACAIDDDYNVLCVGYNGFARKVKDTEERLNDRALKYPLTIHAEGNLVAAAARKGVSLLGSTVLVTSLFPCSNCAGLLVQAGVKRILTTVSDNERWIENAQLSQIIFEEAEIEIVIIEKDASGKWIESKKQ